MLSAGTVNDPLAPLTVVDSASVVVLLAVIVAPGTKPPSTSTTTPVMDEVAAPWPKAGTLASVIADEIANASSRERVRCMVAPYNVRQSPGRAPAGTDMVGSGHSSHAPCWGQVCRLSPIDSS